MAEFPNPAQIIEELNECQSFIVTGSDHSRQGELAAADYIYSLAKRWGLGDVTISPIPKSKKFEYFAKQEPGLSNIVIDAGTGKDERMILHGHFDTVAPSSYGSPEDGRLVRDPNQAHIYRGLGSYDMLSGVASILTAMHNMRIAAHRNIRAILVFGEENDSEGTHAAFDPNNNFFEYDGERVALSTEITVGSKMSDPYHIVVGRPGRFGLKAKIFGEAMHAGDITKKNKREQTNFRANAVQDILFDTEFQPHPQDTRQLLYPGQIVTGEYASDKTSGPISSPGMEKMDIIVHYAHPSIAIADMYNTIRQQMITALGDERFELKIQKRDMPWTPPWLEPLDDPSYRFPHHIQNFAQQIIGHPVDFRTGSGVADENIISANGIPVICIPPRGEGAHTNNECVDIRSVMDYQVPVMRAAALHRGSLLKP